MICDLADKGKSGGDRTLLQLQWAEQLMYCAKAVRRSGGEPAAINGEDRPIDKTGIFRREKGDRSS
jgi:hypothetical protein